MAKVRLRSTFSCQDFVEEFEEREMVGEFFAVVAVGEEGEGGAVFWRGHGEGAKAGLAAGVDEVVAVGAFLDAPAESP